MKPIYAENLPLEKVFASDFEFEIPRYQRPYAWTTDEADQLLEDLRDALDSPDDDPYFLGSVVLVKEDLKPHAEVIDGQQRLTTFTILFAVMRDLSTNDALRRGIQERIADTSKSWKTNAQSRPRLTLRPQDRLFFRTRVQTEGAIATLLSLPDKDLQTDAQRNIRENAKSLHAELSGWTESKRQQLFEMVTEQAQLVVVRTPDQTSAHRIFSVMNARGLDLSPTDIFKSSVIGTLSDHQEEEYAGKWEKAEDDLGREDFRDLFLDIRTLQTKERSRLGLLKEFPVQVLDSYTAIGLATEFVDDLVLPYAQAFSDTKSRDFGPGDDWEQVNRWLGWLDQLENKDWRPVALWALVRHRHDPATLREFLRRLERLAASLLLRREYTTPRVNRYLELLEQLDAGGGLSSPAFDLSVEEKAEARERIVGEIYLFRPIRKYVLTRLDELLAKDRGATYHHNVITVEHVLPQNPDPSSEWMKNFDDDERLHWTHRLGNLLLLNRAVNSAARNYDFDKKKQQYFTTKNGVTNFVITTQVIGEPTWTPDVVERRHRAATDRLVAEWELS